VNTDFHPNDSSPPASSPAERPDSPTPVVGSRARPTGPSSRHQPQDMTEATKLRLRFAKRGDLRLVSHHDVMRCMERMVRRAEIPLATSQGFNPRPRIVFALALGLGIEGRDEVVDIELAEPRGPEDVLRRLEEAAPPGFDWLAVEALAPTAPAPRPVIVGYEIPVPTPRREATRAALATLLSEESRLVTRRRPDRGREQTIDLRPFLIDAELTAEGMLRASLRVSPEGSARPEELLETLGLRDLLDHGSFLSRTRVELAR
jgi:radical SAM-linked protein